METLHEGEELVFLYQLIQGSCDTSYAGHVAAIAGLPANIIKRGNQVRPGHTSMLMIPIIDGMFDMNK